MMGMTVALTVAATASGGVILPQSAVAAPETAFDPQTVMWTNNPIENVLAQAGIYSNAAEVNPNASKDATSVQNPYANSGTKYNGWEYAEFCWTNSYPVGNGRMAGMVAGGIDKEVIQINEDTCWDGSPYGTLKDESGNTLTTLAQTKEAQTIMTENQTSGSVEEGWRYFRGADEANKPAAIGAADVLVGDETFRSSYPAFANKSIANQALNVNNAKDATAVQDRWSMERMVEATFLGSPSSQRAYKSFAEVYLDFGQNHSQAENYTKSLDMKTGVVTIEYDYNDTHFKRETFASYPDQVVATHVESDAELDFSAQLHTYHSDKDGYYRYETVSDKEVKLTAAITNGSKDNNETATVNAIQFEARMILDGDGTFTVSEDQTTVSVKGGKTADIYVVGATNYVDYLTLDNSKPGRDCDKYAAQVKSKTYQQIKQRHLDDFCEQFARTELNLVNSNGKDYSNTPTEKRVRMDKDGKSGFLTGAASRLSDANKAGVYSTYSKGDNQLAALEFNYGKYLILCGSRAGRTASGAGEIDIPESQPLNLTGKWNAALSASWKGKYTVNINTEMNYWAAQPLNLSDSERPLINTFDELAQSGSITAANQYAVYNERGDKNYQPGDPWVMHHNYDLWRGTQPIDNATAGLWPTGGIWLLDHAWQYYLFNKDTDYLAEVYPYLVGAAKFFTQFLVVDPKTGYLVTAASCSPEQGGVQPGPAMDTQLVRNLYDTVQKASDILGKTQENANLLAKIAEQMPSSYLADEAGKLAPNLIDSAGLIKEWARGDVSFDISKRDGGTWTVTNPFTNEKTEVYAHGASNTAGHRHCSHLWELFPGTHLSAYSDDANEKAIFKAFQKSTSARGAGSGQGWGLAWRINLNARALDGNAASTMLEQLFTTRTSPNLFDQHPNFQIDGNYGATSGIIEMLVQSHDGAITLLPALPDRWAEGSFKGLNTREGATVDLAWKDSKPAEAKLHARETGDLSVRSKYVSEAKVYGEDGAEVAGTLNADRNLITFPVEAGKTYTINNFGTNVVDGDKTYKAADVTEFFASDGGTAPKLANSDTEVGYLYRRNGVRVGYAVADFDFDGLTNLLLKMPSVRSENIYVTVNVDSKNGTEIAKQMVSTGDNELELKNLDGISGTHKIYLSFIQNPYDTSSTDKYLGNAGDLIATYHKVNPPSPTESPAPDRYEYQIQEAYFDTDGKLNAKIVYTGEGTAPAAKLIAASYTETGLLINSETFDINGSEPQNLDYPQPDSGEVRLYIWEDVNTMRPMSAVKKVDVAPIPKPTATAMPKPTATAMPKPTATPEPKPTATPIPANQGAYIGEVKYNTVREAVSAAALMPPTKEEERIMIDIMPGIYREQVVVNTPYITLRKKPGAAGEVKLTWYYGLGTLYDSCNENGYYDPAAVGDGKAYGPKDWGPTLKVDKNAVGFTAEQIVLENSYNRYYTQEELTDAVGVDPSDGNSNFRRIKWIKEQLANGVSDDTINECLQSRIEITYDGITSSPRERSAALHASADRCSFIGCNIISTQDTIGINNGRMYFKDCVLGGTTDYICGSATAVFDGCELYVNAGKGGESATITAPSNPAESDGYLFYNCHVTGSKNAKTGNFGRPWSGVNASANYINTVIDYCNGSTSELLIENKGWTDMSGVQPKDARFHEYGSVDAKGKPVSTVLRPAGTLLNEWSMLRYNPLVFTQGKDGWDPAGLAEKYEGVNTVMESTVIDTSDSTTNEISLPGAPSGYQFKWESESEFATVNSEGTKLTLIRPAYGEQPIHATVKLYVRDAAKQEIGGEKSIRFDIQPTSETENVFAVSGTVTMPAASEEAQIVTIEFKRGEAVIKTVHVTLEPGETTKKYTAEYIPVGAYTAYPSAANDAYNVETAPASIAGVKGDRKTYDIQIRKMQTIVVASPDFDGQGYTPSVTPASGFSAGVYTASGTENANLGGAGNKVFKLAKNEGSKAEAKTGVSFDLKSMLKSGSSLANTKTIRFSYDFLMESTAYYPSEYSYFDLATSKSNAGANAADQTRFVRWGVHKGWGQLNFFTAANNRVNGDKTQFDKNNAMANRWYRIVGEIDLVTNTVTTTVYDRDKDMEILNGKPFTIAAPDENGENPNYPANINLDHLYFNIYLDKNANTTNRMEYYLDNITLEYQDYE